MGPEYLYSAPGPPSSLFWLILTRPLSRSRLSPSLARHRSYDYYTQLFLNPFPFLIRFGGRHDRTPKHICYTQYTVVFRAIVAIAELARNVKSARLRLTEFGEPATAETWATPAPPTRA